MNQGYIRLSRDFPQWEFYKNRNVAALYLHLLLTGAYAPFRWRGIALKRGERFCSRSKLAEELGMSAKEVRLALDKLEEGGQIRRRSGKWGTIVEILGYEYWQGNREKRREGPRDLEKTQKTGPSKGQAQGEKGPYKNKTGKENLEREKERIPLTGDEKERAVVGEFRNVFLTKEERQSLALRFGEEHAEQVIEEFSAYCQATGRHYADHYAALVSWCRRRQGQGWEERQSCSREEQSFADLARSLEGESL